MIQKIEAQGKFWVLDIDKEWDGVGYPNATTVYACPLDSEEKELFENLFTELKNKEVNLEHEHTRIDNPTTP